MRGICHIISKHSNDSTKIKLLQGKLVFNKIRILCYNEFMFRCSECGCEYETKPDFCDCGNDIFEEVLPCPEKEDAKPSFNMKPADIVSYLIFVVCIILSVLVLLFFPKITPTPQNNTHEQVLKPNTNIPDLSSIWIDSKPKQESIIDMIKDVVTAPPKEEKRAPQKVITAPVQQKQQLKPIQQTKTVQSPKPAQQAKPVKNNISTPTVGKPQTSSYSYEVVN